ncbi:hypothetical protein V6C53_13730 [Desulfocurvibacter africanus]|uniref:hypothetical protein n=1 Tax=Desulfocurvibacter africanus TaxID=873 RepID=UPI002FDB5070
MPPTYYDFIRNLRSFVVDLAEQDALELLALTHPPTTIHSVDDFDSRFEQCIAQVDQEVLEHVAKITGLLLNNPGLHLPMLALKPEHNLPACQHLRDRIVARESSAGRVIHLRSDPPAMPTSRPCPWS